MPVCSIYLQLACLSLGFVLCQSMRAEEAQAVATHSPGRFELYQNGDAEGKPVLQVTHITSDSGGTEFATIHRPAEAGHPATEHQIELGEKGAKYVIAWQRGAGSIWIADESTLREVNVDDPNQIRTNIFGRNNNGGWGEIPKAVLEELEKVYPIGRKDGSIGGNFGGQTIATAKTSDEWQVEGSVTGPDGKPISYALITVNTEYKPLEIVARVTTDSNGVYALHFRTDLETLSKFRGVKIQASLPGYREKNYNTRGQFLLALGANESIQEERLPRLTLDRPERLDFVLVPDFLNAPKSEAR